MLLSAFIKKLEDQTSPEHQKMAEYVRGKRILSSGDMSKFHETWDYNDLVFRGLRAPDRDDRNAVSRGQPPKLTVPLTQSQVLTYVAFNCAVLQQNRRFFQLEPTGTEDNPLREPLELLLERDVRRNTWQTHQIQWFHDIGVFGLAVAEIGWEEKMRRVRLEREVVSEGLFGTEPTTTTESVYEEVPVFVGNRIHPVSPYRFFPDTNHPLTRFQEGEFCGHQDDYSMQALRGMAGLINTDKVPKMTEEMFLDRKKSCKMPSGITTRVNPQQGVVPGGDADEMDDSAYCRTGTVLIDKFFLDLVPKDFKVNGESIGAQDFSCRFLVWLANDQTIVRFEEATLLHNQFPYTLGQHLPDQHHLVNISLADCCDQLTSYITWLFNAHITSQRNVIKGGKFLIDPAGVDVKGLDSDSSPFIFLKKNASQTGVDRYIKQFQVTDPTGNFMADAAGAKQLLGEVTGYSDLLSGQFSQGRRDATQSRAVIQSGSARGKCTLGGIWDTLFEPMGRQLIANNRQEMEQEDFQRILGSAATPELWSSFKADPISIACGEDFFTFDATLPSEQAFLAQSLQEILMMMMQSPQVAMLMGYGPEQFKQILTDIYNLRGVTPARLPSPTQPTGPVDPNVISMMQQAEGPPAAGNSVAP